jgi:hypothetical protein
VQLSIKRGFGRYTALFVGLGAAGLAIGWIGPDITATLIANRSQLSRVDAHVWDVDFCPAALGQ